MSAPDIPADMPADVRDAIFSATAAYLDKPSFCGTIGQISHRMAQHYWEELAPFFAAKDAEIADLKRKAIAADSAFVDKCAKLDIHPEDMANLPAAFVRLRSESSDLKEQLAEAKKDSARLRIALKRMYGEFTPLCDHHAEVLKEASDALGDAAMQQEGQQ